MAADSLDALKRDLRLHQSRVELRQQGSGLIGICPLHEEKTPSLRVDHKDGICMHYCFGYLEDIGKIKRRTGEGVEVFSRNS